ncbi:MAG: hypothetical protein AAGI34_01260 [Pseudomonadota bacterium]
MQKRLYTVHSRRDSDRLKTVTESGPLSVVPPLWAAWNGLWLMVLLMLGAMATIAVLQPLALGTVWAALIALAYAEGDTLARIELRLRGWREVGVVEAASEAGAEELYIDGHAADPRA